MVVHSDLAAVMPEPWVAPQTANVIWCLTDVHRDNGATLHVPGSHRWTTLADVPADTSVLEDIVDHTNVGAIFRAAAGLGDDRHQILQPDDAAVGGDHAIRERVIFPPPRRLEAEVHRPLAIVRMDTFHPVGNGRRILFAIEAQNRIDFVGPR